MLPRVVGEAARRRRRRAWRQEQTEREREAWRKEYGKGGRKEAAKGREKKDETQEKLAGGRFGPGKQFFDPRRWSEPIAVHDERDARVIN